MKKQELIERYGLEWYEQHKARNKAYSKEHNKARYQNDAKFRESKKAQYNAYRSMRYNNDSEFREYMNAQQKVYRKARYVKDGRIDLIENYDLAMKDNFKGWTIHHRLEIHDDYVNTRQELIMMNLYYDRPPEELIWIRRSDHTRMHNIARNSYIYLHIVN